MFELHQKPAMLVKFNPRPENHGQEVVPAGDLKFRANVEQATLDALSPVLRYMFFAKNGSESLIPADRQDLADQVHEAPNLRAGAKLLGPHRWAAKFAGYQLRIHLGTRESAHVVVDDCDFNDISFEPQEGGTVILRFRLQFHPDEKQAGKLSMLQKTMVDISLVAPEGAREIEPGEEGREQEDEA